MPIYEWRCAGCGDTAEVLRSVEDYNKPPEQVCKKCINAPDWKRKIGTASVPFEHLRDRGVFERLPTF